MQFIFKNYHFNNSNNLTCWQSASLIFALSTISHLLQPLNTTINNLDALTSLH